MIKKMKFIRLRRKLMDERDIREERKLGLAKINLQKELDRNGKVYKGTDEQKLSKLTKYLKNQINKAYVSELEQLEQIEQAEDFKGELVITLEWKKNRTWGNTVKSITNYGFESDVVSGCGYCKTSTATAYALNSRLSILKLIYAKKEEALSKPKYRRMENNSLNREVLGYGSGYGILPQIEGGVGIPSHIRIMARIGLEMRHITDTRWCDVFIIKKKVA